MVEDKETKQVEWPTISFAIPGREREREGGASGSINTHFSHCVMTMLLFEQKHTAKYQPKHTPTHTHSV